MDWNAALRAVRAVPAPWTFGDLRSHEELRAEVSALRREREELLRWVFHLERLAQSGLTAGGMAHDVLNVLSALVAKSQLALGTQDPSAWQDALAQDVGLARHAADAMRVFLSFVRREDVTRERVRVSAVVDDALRFVEHVVRAANVSIVRGYEPGDDASCNRTLLLQAVVNLLLNATTALGPRGGRIEVRTSRRGGLVVLDLEDDGPGIPAPVRASLFQPFTTSGPREVCGSRSGSGLGLFITKQIVEEMGGRIRCRTREGVGTLFSVLLRVEDAQGDATTIEGGGCDGS